MLLVTYKYGSCPWNLIVDKLDIVLCLLYKTMGSLECPLPFHQSSPESSPQSSLILHKNSIPEIYDANMKSQLSAYVVMMVSSF